MKTQTRSLNQLVDEQLKKWQGATVERKSIEAKPGPVITVSREPGTGGSEIARRLAAKLKMDLVGAQIIQKIAESAHMSAKVIESLDEKDVTRRDDWLSSMFETRHLWMDDYLHHLTKVIGTFGRQGNMIIVGRGAQYILPPELMVSGRYDPTFWFEFTDEMFRTLKEKGLRLETLVLPCGHYSLELAPFAFPAGLRLGLFLFEALA